MPVTHNDLQVLWSTASNKAVAAATSETSDALSINATAIEGLVHLKADNSTTPAAGDTVDFFILYTPSTVRDGATASDDFDTAGHAQFLARLDTNAEDPAKASIPVSMAAAKLQIHAVSNASANSITVSAAVTEVRG